MFGKGLDADLQARTATMNGVSIPVCGEHVW